MRNAPARKSAQRESAGGNGGSPGVERTRPAVPRPIRILVVDDEASVRRLLSAILEDRGYEVVEATGVAEARKALGCREIHVVLTDQRMQDGQGLEVLAAARESDPNIPVVFLTGVATVELAVDAMRSGAFDFLSKPFLPEQALAVVGRATERAALIRENESLKGQVRRLTPATRLVGHSAAVEELRELIQRIAPTDATCLIIGETGSGKEVVAQALHQFSRRAERPFLPVNCAGFSETLLESELFGHERGAFTGADRQRSGVFEAAHGGTLFLDEAGEMSLALQAKLLRVLVTGEVVRVGSNKPKHVDVRIVVATHRDLRQRVQEGLFREDLYYRLAVVPLQVPPLRQRKEDIQALAEELLAQISRELKIRAPSLSAAALEKLSGYDFPGNVRELRNLLERAVILVRGGTLEPSDLPLNGGSAAQSPHDPFERWIASLPGDLNLRAVGVDVEKALVTRALAASKGVAAQAARTLGLSRSDLAYKLRRLDMTRKA
jgi:DNA-binding NtrC family response regulator